MLPVTKVEPSDIPIPEISIPDIPIPEISIPDIPIPDIPIPFDCPLRPKRRRGKLAYSYMFIIIECCNYYATLS